MTGPTDPASGNGSQEWQDVLARMSELAEAVGRWAKAATNDPETKQRLAQVRSGIDDLARKADEAMGRVEGTDLGKRVKDGAEQTGQVIGEAAQRVTEVAAPAVKSALAGLSDAFGKAAVKLDEANKPSDKK